jgi:hypothetical protein
MKRIDWMKLSRCGVPVGAALSALAFSGCLGQPMESGPEPREGEVA